MEVLLLFFFFQAEDGIRDYKVTGVQTCALPISMRRSIALPLELVQRAIDLRIATRLDDHELGVHAAPRERGLHPLGLPPCELAPPCAQLERSDHPSLVPRPSSP